MSSRVTQSYVAVPRAVHEDVAMAPRGVPFARARLIILCTCDDPQSVVVGTGPVMCRSCGRRIG